MQWIKFNSETDGIPLLNTAECIFIHKSMANMNFNPLSYRFIDKLWALNRGLGVTVFFFSFSTYVHSCRMEYKSNFLRRVLFTQKSIINNTVLEYVVLEVQL